MPLRRAAPLIVGLVAILATVVALWWLRGEAAFDVTAGANGPAGAGAGAAAQMAEPTDDGTYACSPLGDPAAPRLSASTGFHSEPFELELVSDGDAPLYYTLDGSYPDPVGNASATHEYTEPLTIDTNTGPYSLTAMRSAFDRTQLAERRSSPDVWNIGHSPFDGGVVVRVREVADADGDADADAAGDGDAAEGTGSEPANGDPQDADGAAASPECVGVFFVGEHLVRHDLPVMHLSLSPDHFFDRETGIYLPGKTFEDYLASDEFNAQWAEQFGLVPANYRERGREWERPFEDHLDDAVVMHHFTPGGEVAYSSNLGVRIHGGWTRAFPQKTLRLYARNDYGNRTFDYPFFGDDGPDTHRRLILRNSGNDWEWTMLLDGYVQLLIHHLDIETQAYQPTVLFINGEYWGIHNLRERFDRHYLEIAHGVDADNVAIVGGYGPCCEVNTGEEDDDEPYRQLLFDLQEMDPTDPATLAHVESQMDVDDLIDYLAIQLFVSNTDWPQNNLKLWREKVEPDAGVGSARDGRWRFLVYDLDFVGNMWRDHFHDPFERLGEMAAAGDPLADMGIPFLFQQLTANDEFRERFATRFADLANTAFRSDHAIAELDSLIRLLEPEMHRHIDRWGNSSASNWWPADTPMRWHERLGEVRRFFTERPGIARHFASEHLGLGGAVRLDVATEGGAEAGHVVVNTLDVVADAPGVADPTSWSGHYFREAPVTVRAVPADGYRFVRWDGVPADAAESGEDGEVVVLHLADETAITAVFEPA